MSTPFFITGLPRSRTAWFAIATSTDRSVCHHEPHYGDFETAAELWAMQSRYEFVGIADAGLGMHLRRILDEVGPRTLIIDRDPMAVASSLRKYMGLSEVRLGPGWYPAVLARLKVLVEALAVEHPLIKRVAFDDLKDIYTLRDCFDWLMPGCKPLNLTQLMHMNIQSDLGYNLAKLSRFRDPSAA